MIEVTYVDHMGSDERVADAARVSFAKEASSYSAAQNRRLLAYLAEHNHWSPFAHCSLTVHVKAPIFVARQLQKHQVGLAWNEVSRRYVDADPEFYAPSASALPRRGQEAGLVRRSGDQRSARGRRDRVAGPASRRCLPHGSRDLRRADQGRCRTGAGAHGPSAGSYDRVVLDRLSGGLGAGLRAPLRA